jgi:hypothetical protein
MKVLNQSGEISSDIMIICLPSKSVELEIIHSLRLTIMLYDQ